MYTYSRLYKPKHVSPFNQGLFPPPPPLHHHPITPLRLHIPPLSNLRGHAMKSSLSFWTGLVLFFSLFITTAYADDSCDAGSFKQNGQCKKCPANQYSLAGDRACTPCPSGSSASVGSGSCRCASPKFFTTSTTPASCVVTCPAVSCSVDFALGSLIPIKEFVRLTIHRIQPSITTLRPATPARAVHTQRQEHPFVERAQSANISTPSMAAAAHVSLGLSVETPIVNNVQDVGRARIRMR